MNESFKSVFTVKGTFIEPNTTEAEGGLKEVVVQKQDVGRLLENLDVRKAMGPDGVSGWTLKECKEQ